jgi:hypothetical protein
MSSSEAEPYKIFCFLLGEKQPSQIEIAKHKTVADLKQAIKNKRSNTLTDIDADALTLYQIDVDDDENLENSVLSGSRTFLRPTMELVKVYSDPPLGGKVHIFVELPSGT